MSVSLKALASINKNPIGRLSGTLRASLCSEWYFCKASPKYSSVGSRVLKTGLKSENWPLLEKTKNRVLFNNYSGLRFDGKKYKKLP